MYPLIPSVSRWAERRHGSADFSFVQTGMNAVSTKRLKIWFLTYRVLSFLLAEGKALLLGKAVFL